MDNNIIICDKKRFEEIKTRIANSGNEKIHVVSDFDRTLTKAFYKEKKVNAVISLLRSGEYLVKDYALKAHSLFDKYHPIEIDSRVPMNEKKEKMQEWWEKSEELLIEFELDKKTMKQCIKDAIKKDKLVFRGGAEEFFQILKKENIPLIIMSASLRYLIEEFMKQKKVYSSNVHVVANTFKFDKNGKAIKIEKIVHILNKNEIEIKDSSVYNNLLKRKNVILLGDHLGDLGMIEGFDYDNLIKIGFLNENVEDNLEYFKKAFDIVILGDGNFRYINELLEELIS